MCACVFVRACAASVASSARPAAAMDACVHVCACFECVFACVFVRACAASVASSARPAAAMDVCVHVCACLYACVRACLCVHVQQGWHPALVLQQQWTCVCMCACLYVCVRACFVCACALSGAYSACPAAATCVITRVYACVHMYVCVCVCVCV